MAHAMATAANALPPCDGLCCHVIIFWFASQKIPMIATRHSQQDLAARSFLLFAFRFSLLAALLENDGPSRLAFCCWRGRALAVALHQAATAMLCDWWHAMTCLFLGHSRNVSTIFYLGAQVLTFFNQLEGVQVACLFLGLKEPTC